MFLSKQHLFHIEKNEVQRHRNRKNHNQYFTPEFAVKRALSFIKKAKIANVIDPAVGNGVFLKEVSKRWQKAKLFGIDIDKDMIFELNKSNLSNSYFACGNSLLKETWQIPEIQNVLSRGGFDLVVGNPPFSSWFHRIKTSKILADYRLAYRNGKLMRSQAIEVLFVEIFVKLAREGGYIVIVLPDGILSNPQYRYVREFILTKTKVKYVINLPRNVFKDTSAKTSILILEKTGSCILNYSTRFYDLEITGRISHGIEVKSENLINRMDYWYYYYLQKNTIGKLLNNKHKFVPLRNFVIYCKTGKTLYGKERKFSDKGLKFLHATNITEIGINYRKDEKFIDPLSNMNFPDAYARVGDILFVRVGVGCVGRVAIVDVKDDEGVVTDYIHIFRVKGINPYFLVVYLKTKFGKDSINLLKHGVGTVSINKTDLLSLPIPLVSEKIQEDMANRYKEILKKWRIAIANNQDTSVYETMMRDIISYLEEILEEGL